MAESKSAALPLGDTPSGDLGRSPHDIAATSADCNNAGTTELAAREASGAASRLIFGRKQGGAKYPIHKCDFGACGGGEGTLYTAPPTVTECSAAW